MNPRTPAKKPVEKKVTVATVATYLGVTAVLAVLGTVQDNPLLVEGLPNLLEALLLGAIPALITFVSGYQTRHTTRQDLGEVPPPAAGRGRPAGPYPYDS
jgi:hypothetical protein